MCLVHLEEDEGLQLEMWTGAKSQSNLDSESSRMGATVWLEGGKG